MIFKKKDSYSANNGEYVVKKTKGLDIAAKIMSVLIAIVIWLYAISANSPVYEGSVSGVPVSVENVPTGLSVISGLDHTIDIKVQGKRSEVLALTANDIKAYVDASASVEPGLHTLTVNVTLPSNMKLSETYPETVTVYLDTTTSKQLPIKIHLRNYTVDADCVLEKSTPELSSVTVKGPADELKKIKEAIVTIEPGYITSSMNASGSVVLYDNDGNIFSNPYVTCSAADVLVRIEIHKYKTVPLTVNYKYGYYNEDTVSVEIVPESIKVKGPADLIDDISTINVATIDETEIMSDGSIVYGIDLPDGVTAAENIENVKVNIKHKNTAVKTFSVDNILLENPEDGKTYKFASNTVNVTLRGTVGEYFTYFDADDITVVLDMKNYKGMSGDVTVPARIEILNSSTESVIYALGSYSVHLNIS